MANIASGNQITTLVTVYEVDTTDQQRLVDLLRATYDQLIVYQPGFISAQVLQGLEGTRVLAYSQWESRAAAETVLRSDELWPTLIEIQRVAVADPWFYETAFARAAPTHDSGGEDSTR